MGDPAVRLPCRSFHPLVLHFPFRWQDSDPYLEKKALIHAKPLFRNQVNLHNGILLSNKKVQNTVTQSITGELQNHADTKKRESKTIYSMLPFTWSLRTGKTTFDYTCQKLLYAGGRGQVADWKEEWWSFLNDRNVLYLVFSRHYAGNCDCQYSSNRPLRLCHFLLWINYNSSFKMVHER